MSQISIFPSEDVGAAKEQLLALGFGSEGADAIILASGPNYAVMAGKWAMGTIKRLEERNDISQAHVVAALMSLFRGMRSGDRDLKVQKSASGRSWRFESSQSASILRALGIEPPKTDNHVAFFSILHGADVALENIPV